MLCLGIGWLAGHRSYVLPSLAFLTDQQQAEFYDLNGGVTSDNLIGRVDVSELTPLLVSATWRSGGIRVHKGEFQLIFGDGTHLRLRAPGTYFLVDGWPGYFEFPEDKQESVRSYLGQLMDETIIPWRKREGVQLGHVSKAVP